MRLGVNDVGVPHDTKFFAAIRRSIFLRLALLACLALPDRGPAHPILPSIFRVASQPVTVSG